MPLIVGSISWYFVNSLMKALQVIFDKQDFQKTTSNLKVIARDAATLREPRKPNKAKG